MEQKYIVLVRNTENDLWREWFEATDLTIRNFYEHEGQKYVWYDTNSKKKNDERPWIVEAIIPKFAQNF